MKANRSIIVSNTRRRKLNGFTLTEVLISAAIVSTALLTVIGLFSSGLTIGRESSQATAASVLARRIAEDARLSIESPSATSPPSLNKPLALSSASRVTPPISQIPLGVYTASLEPSTSVHTSRNASLTTALPAYTKGFAELDATYLATWQTIDRADLAPGSQLLVVTVEAPASVPAKNRKIYRYATLVQRSQP